MLSLGSRPGRPPAHENWLRQTPSGAQAPRGRRKALRGAGSRSAAAPLLAVAGRRLNDDGGAARCAEAATGFEFQLRDVLFEERVEHLATSRAHRVQLVAAGVPLQ